MNAPLPTAQPAADDDSMLAARAAAGDQSAFAHIMRRHNRRLFRTARSILKADAEAEDALQDAYLRAWQALAGFRAEAQLATWLTRIVINEALGRLRRQRTQPQAVDGDAALQEATMQGIPTTHPADQPESVAARGEMRALLEAQIDALPQSYRTVFMLRAVEDLSVEEVASVLDMPAATVRTRHFRARGLLRERLSRALDMAERDAFAFDGARCDRIVARVMARLPAGASR